MASGQSQERRRDFSTWWEVEIRKSIDRGIDLNAELEQRFRNNSLQYDRTLTTLSVDYGIYDFLDVSAGIRVMLDNDNESGLSVRSRFHADATGSYRAGDLDLSLRSRIQYGFGGLSQRTSTGGNRWMNRYRLEVEHHIFGTRIGWSASVEPWFLLNDRNRRPLKGLRFAAGVRYNLDFISRVDVRFIREEEVNEPDPLQSNILVLGYTRNL